jgi:hypothetical protein
MDVNDGNERGAWRGSAGRSPRIKRRGVAVKDANERGE